VITPANNLQQPQEGSNHFEKIGLLLIIAVAAAIRSTINFSTQLMPGVNAAYYPVQVRSLLDNGQLGFPDLPFVFYFEAGFARVLEFAGLCDLNGCIMVSSKITDSLLYPLIAIPTFLLAKSVAAHIKAPRWVLFIPPLLMAVSMPALVMMADFQKNSIGLMWSIFFIYFLYLAMKDGKLLNYLLAGVFFVLAGLTHLGCLGFVIAFSLSYFVFSIIFQRERRINLLKVFGLLALAGGLASLALFFLDPDRLGRLANAFAAPLQMFENPTILGILEGKVPLQPHLFITVFVATLLVIVSLVLFFAKRKEIPSHEKALFAASLVLTAFMSSLLLEEELGNRLYMMAYVPAVLLFIFPLKYIFGKWKKYALITLILIMMVGPTPVTWNIRGAKCITDKAYAYLFKLGTAIENPDKTLIITRHGLEFWTVWALDVDVSHGRDINEEVLKNYDVVYYLRQEKGQGNFGPFGPGGPPFPEVWIPPDAEIVYQDEFYILAKAPPGPPRFHYEDDEFKDHGPKDFEGPRDFEDYEEGPPPDEYPTDQNINPQP
jgi:hypothetical protein